MSSLCRSRLRPSRRARVICPRLHPNRRRGAHFSDVETWQAEALDPNDLASILRAAIEDRLDRGMYQAILTEEAALRRELLSRFA